MFDDVSDYELQKDDQPPYLEARSPLPWILASAVDCSGAALRGSTSSAAAIRNSRARQPRLRSAAAPATRPLGAPADAIPLPPLDETDALVQATRGCALVAPDGGSMAGDRRPAAQLHGGGRQHCRRRDARSTAQRPSACRRLPRDRHETTICRSTRAAMSGTRRLRAPSTHWIRRVRASLLDAETADRGCVCRAWTRPVVRRRTRAGIRGDASNTSPRR